MRDDEIFVLNSVAATFAGTWEPGEDPPDGYLTFGGRTIAVEVSTLTQHVTDHRGTRPRLSDDATALKLADELDASLSEAVPSDTLVILALRSPINEYRKTKVDLASEIADLLRSKSPSEVRVERKVKIRGNEIDICVAPSNGVPDKKVCAAVTNRLSNPRIQANVAYILEDRIVTKSKKCEALACRGPIWLALLNDYFLTDAHSYRYALQFVTVEHPFERILLVSPQGSTDALA